MKVKKINNIERILPRTFLPAVKRECPYLGQDKGMVQQS